MCSKICLYRIATFDRFSYRWPTKPSTYTRLGVASSNSRIVELKNGKVAIQSRVRANMKRHYLCRIIASHIVAMQCRLKCSSARPRSGRPSPPAETLGLISSQQSAARLSKQRWAGAAAPAQRNTARPQKPPRTADGVFYGSNLSRKDNPRWLIDNATETTTGPRLKALPRRDPSARATES